MRKTIELVCYKWEGGMDRFEGNELWIDRKEKEPWSVFLTQSEFVEKTSCSLIKKLKLKLKLF